MIVVPGELHAQALLDKRITLEVKRQRLDDVLTIISDKGGFAFSYNSSIIKRDSLVSLHANDQTVRQVLNQLLNMQYEYKESGNYIILRRVSLRLTTITDKTPVTDNVYTISGYVVNSETGERIPNVSVYETGHLVSSLTDQQGNFTLKLRSSYPEAILSVSKYAYEDTMISLQPMVNTQLVIAIVPVIDTSFESTPNVYEVADDPAFKAPARPSHDTDSLIHIEPLKIAPVDVEQTAIAKFLLTAQQKMQSLNIRKFLGKKPIQLSLLPTITTQGRMNGLLVHHVSLNLIGGYTGGVDGVELGGLFNLNRRDVRYVQVAGLFNITGGTVTGLQVAGLSNTLLGSIKGLQIGGLVNYVKKDVNAFQLAGIGNASGGQMNGLQLGGIFNYARRLKGMQIGLINIADTSDGYSIGLINIVLKGYHKLSIFTNETVNGNVAFKTGSRHLYSILLGGMNISNGPASSRDEKVYTFGYGLGTEKKLSRWLTLNPELSSQYLYLGDWDHLNLLNKLSLNLNIRIIKRISVFGGPSVNMYYTDQLTAVDGYRFPGLSTGTHTFRTGLDHTRGFFGWNAGINFF